MEEVRIIPAEEQHIEAACEIAIKAWTPIREIFRRAYEKAGFQKNLPSIKNFKKL